MSWLMLTHISVTRRRRSTWRSSTLAAGASTRDPGWVSTAPATIPGHSITGAVQYSTYSTEYRMASGHSTSGQSILKCKRIFSYLNHLTDHLARLIGSTYKHHHSTVQYSTVHHRTSITHLASGWYDVRQLLCLGEVWPWALSSDDDVWTRESSAAPDLDPGWEVVTELGDNRVSRIW